MTTTVTINIAPSLSPYHFPSVEAHAFDYQDPGSRMPNPLQSNLTRAAENLETVTTNESSAMEYFASDLQSDTVVTTCEIFDRSETINNPSDASSSPLFNSKDTTTTCYTFPLSTTRIKQEKVSERISSCNGTRRSIFPELCNEQHRLTTGSSPKYLVSTTPSTIQSRITTNRPRAMTDPSSRCLPEYMKVHGVSRHDISEFRRPSNCRYHPDHLKGIEEHPNLHKKLGLPDLPSPLQRMRKSAGVYPLLSPQSILRRRPRSLIATDRTMQTHNHSNSQSLAATLTQVMASADRKNLVLFPSSLFSTTMKVSETSTTSTESLDSRTTGSGASRDVSVRFDPRLTVTEYDDNIERKWYSEAELREFQSNTVLLVKQYLMNNPAALLEYNTPRLDPVTGAMKRKALFSIPILGIENDDDEDVTHGTAIGPCPNQSRTNAFLDFAVKTILIVDRNKLILDLFRRSLQILFPKACIVTLDSGDEACTLIQSKLSDCPSNGTAPESFDIIIAEERLYIPLQRSPAAMSTRKDPSLTIGVSDHSKSGQHNKHVRVQSLNAVGRKLTQSPPKNWNGISGSELFQQIRDMERVALFASMATPTIDLLECEMPPAQCSVLIGVSTNPNQDSKRFLEHGADFVWGKPPPCMNIELRNELITALINKRRNKTALPGPTTSTARSR